MLEFLNVVILYCSVHTGSGNTWVTLRDQRECVASILKCSKTTGGSVTYTDVNNLNKCMLDNK